ncbi:DUF4384 domain-containing protein [Paracraurococcus lichenis]|uniref:DUF4384 domain-containing protein n=1 Tax=Paracraurococcus lichenis TaxID=3064888 RepID=A0ABT9DW46_9PROT|nr:DUF4384 domain-containing protein [Paracraurococcus sp. LOR1-02]MDO9708127.1 hypothetical protein [Paracraurococcus sp. LOR1-02]
MRRPTLPALAAALVLCWATPRADAADSAVLLSATAPGYAPGMVIGPQERLRVPDGASLTLLLRSGQMLKLRGPVETSLDRAEPLRQDGSALSLAEAFRLRGVDASAIGGTRAAAPERRLARGGDVPVEIERSGTWCIGAADTVWLMRPAQEPSELGLRRRGSTRRLAWPAGAARLEWPGELPIEDGDRFEVLADGQAVASLTFRLTEGTARSEAAMVAQGLLLGCRDQYAPALRRLARGSLPPELWLSTDRGRQPVQKPGERINLQVMADAEGWLYCVTTRSDGSAVAVFPAGAIGGAALPAATPASLHGQRQSVALTAGPPGTQHVQCWLADRDIGPELPHALLDASGARLPDRLAGELDAIFAGTGGRITRAALDIRVE